MSSVTRFIRQIPTATTYYDADGVIATPGDLAYEFVPTSSNYVGNYPAGFNNQFQGYVAPCGTGSILAVAIAAQAATGERAVLRDMGKTIFAPITTSPSTPPGATALPWGYFRQVQLVVPTTMTQPPSFMGGSNGSNFGVRGGAGYPDTYTSYLTFYIPVTVANVTGAPVNTKAYVIAGGQM
jgi:hypothetical protein